MIAAGIDIGSVATKTLIIDGAGVVLGHNIIPKGAMFTDSARRSFNEALQNSSVNEKDVAYILATGYGRSSVPFAHGNMTEITCHARGVHTLFPRVRTAIDIGGQDCKVISIDNLGRAQDFAMNNRCAAGTGRWLEVMAHVLGVGLDRMGEMALQAQEEIRISSVCTVFAESEVLSYMAGDARLEDVLGGVHRAIVERIVNSLVRRVGATKEVAVAGGGAKNIAIVKEIEKMLGTAVFVPDEPQLTGALGAALIGLERVCASIAAQPRTEDKQKGAPQ